VKVFIITEGSKKIGFGHITRCTSLYEAFEEKGILPTFIINSDEIAKDLLKGKNYKTFDWLKEQEGLLNLINSADIAIIDSYLADYKFYKKVSEIVKIPVYIDDNKRMDYPKGIVVNASVYAKELECPKKEGVIYLVGNKYIFLRKEFWDVPEKGIKENIENIMVTFGGNDPRKMTPKVLKILVDNYPNSSKKIVVGEGFQNTKELEKLEDHKTEFIYYPDARDMKQLMLESDIAISASGQTLFELARIGVPTIAIAVAENQLSNVKRWKKTGFIKYAGWWQDSNMDKNIISCINDFMDFARRKKSCKIGRELVDGSGSKLIVELLVKKAS